MSRAAALAKVAHARRLLDEALRELETADPANDASDPAPIKVSETDKARARDKLRRLGVRV